MNQSRFKGVTKVESAFAFIAAQVDDFNKSTLRTKKRQRTIAKRMLSTATAVVMTVISIIPLHAAEITEQTPQSEAQAVFESSLKLDSQNYSLLAIEESTIEIKPGKSLAQEQEEARLRELAKRRLAESGAPVTQSATSARSIPTEERHRLAQEAASAAGIPTHWKTLAAIWAKETGGREGCIISKADGRATGPMQFMPGTFRGYKPHANANICNARDSLHAAANLLKANGIESGQSDKALFAYNHSMSYVRGVQNIANSIQ